MRLKDVGYLYGGLTGKSGDDFHEEDPDKVKPFIPFTNVFKNFKVDVSDVRYVAMEAGEVQNRVRQGDVLFLMSSEDYDGIGKPAVISDEVPELYLNSFCRGLRITKRNICPEFVNYYLNGHHCREQVRLEGRGFTRVNIKVDRIAGQELKLPLFLDQRRIVEYLDSRCAAIDRTVALLEQKRAAYGRLKRALINETVTRGLDKNTELVDSGVDWLKPGRKNRSVRRLKDCATLNPNCDNASIVGDVSFVPMEALRWGKIDAQTIPIDLAKGKYTPFADGDLLVARVTPCFERGNIAIASGLLQGVGFGSSEIFVLRVNENAVSKYMFYLTLTARFQDGACATMCGVGGLKRISPEFMRTYELDLPSAAEQRRIADYLDRRCAAIDAAVENVTRQIELYRKLKRSLIDEVVTGRRKVA